MNSDDMCEVEVSMLPQHTVDVISPEHTSQINLCPPSVPRVIVFFRITPISSDYEGGR